jgi:hypothetical protein
MRKTTILLVVGMLATAALLAVAPETSARSCKGDPHKVQFCSENNNCFSYTVLEGTDLERSEYDC